MKENQMFLRQAIELAYNNIEKGGRPFGAVIVKDGQVIASGVNQILTTNDPTAHAELLAIRAASQVLGSANLEGCSVCKWTSMPNVYGCNAFSRYQSSSLCIF